MTNRHSTCVQFKHKRKIDRPHMLPTRRLTCPYCGEDFSTEIDPSAGSERYVEDCYVCCRPIEFSVQIDHLGDIVSVTVKRDDE